MIMRYTNGCSELSLSSDGKGQGHEHFNKEKRDFTNDVIYIAAIYINYLIHILTRSNCVKHKESLYDLTLE